MNRAGYVYFNNRSAGRVERTDTEYVFTYDDEYLRDPVTPSIALCFPKSERVFRSPVLFPFFFGLLAEGANRDLQCAVLKIDESDHFTRLLRTAGEATIGAVTVRGEQ